MSTPDQSALDLTDDVEKGLDAWIHSRSPISISAAWRAGVAWGRAHPKSSEKAEAPLDRKVVVCAACLCACCWQGEFYCDQAKTAGTVEKTVRELLQGNIREDSGYWFKDPNTGEVDYDAKSAAKRAWLAENGKANDG